MASIVQTIQKRSTNQGLPVSSPADDKSQQPGIRRRLSSMSLNIQPAIERSKSLSELGGNAGSSIKRWWLWGWDWILSRKPGFALDLEMNEEEKRVLGFQNRGSVMHIFYKLKSEVRKLLRYDDMYLPQTFRYDPISSNNGFKRAALG